MCIVCVITLGYVVWCVVYSYFFSVPLHTFCRRQYILTATLTAIFCLNRKFVCTTIFSCWLICVVLLLFLVTKFVCADFLSHKYFCFCQNFFVPYY